MFDQNVRMPQYVKNVKKKPSNSIVEINWCTIFLNCASENGEYFNFSQKINCEHEHTLLFQHLKSQKTYTSVHLCDRFVLTISNYSHV